MSVWGTLWRSLVEQTVRWQTRPRPVWSTYRGEQRQVTLMWPLRERGFLWYRGLRALLMLAVGAGLVLASAAVIEAQGWAPEGSDGLRSALDESDPTYGVILFATFIGLTLASMAAKLLLSLLLRLYAVVVPRTVEGAALRQRVQVTSRHLPSDAEGPQTSFGYSSDEGSGQGRLHRYQRYYLALDVGAETARAYRVRKRWYDEVTSGDVVRLALVPFTGKVRRVEILHHAAGQGQPAPQLHGPPR
jgi:hypothetical protein